MGNAALQRKNMVEGQVRTSDVTDRRILRAMSDVPRELFAPKDVQALAYFDQDLRVTPVDQPDRFILAPSVFARMVLALDIDSDNVVLDVGCATGYGSAILARLAQTVVGLESDAALAETATKTLSGLSVDNVVIVSGPLESGWPGEGPYDAILINGAIAEAPSSLLQQLRDGGRLVAVLSQGVTGQATLWQRSGGNISSRSLFDAAASPLAAFQRAPQFVF